MKKLLFPFQIKELPLANAFPCVKIPVAKAVLSLGLSLFLGACNMGSKSSPPPPTPATDTKPEKSKEEDKSNSGSGGSGSGGSGSGQGAGTGESGSGSSDSAASNSATSGAQAALKAPAEVLCEDCPEGAQGSQSASSETASSDAGVAKSNIIPRSDLGSSKTGIAKRLPSLITADPGPGVAQLRPQGVDGVKGTGPGATTPLLAGAETAADQLSANLRKKKIDEVYFQKYQSVPLQGLLGHYIMSWTTSQILPQFEGELSIQFFKGRIFKSENLLATLKKPKSVIALDKPQEVKFRIEGDHLVTSRIQVEIKQGDIYPEYRVFITLNETERSRGCTPMLFALWIKPLQKTQIEVINRDYCSEENLEEFFTFPQTLNRL